MFVLHNVLLWGGMIGLIIGISVIVAGYNYYDSFDGYLNVVGITITISAVIALIGAAVIGTQTESFQRKWRTAESDYNGGIERIVDVYAYNGEKIDSFSGKFDIEADGDSNEVMFDSADGRVIIEGGIVIVKEKR